MSIMNFSSETGNESVPNATQEDNKGASIYFPIVMFLTGMLGNVLALAILHRTRRESQRLMFHGLVGGLVWNDLLGIIFTTPVTLASYLNNLEMPGGEHLCRFNGFIMICFGISTPLIVCAMAVERFLFVKYTFFYTRHCPPSTARLVILAIWGFVLLFGLLPLFGFGRFVLQYPHTWCFLDFKTQDPVDAAYGYLYAIINLILAGIMIVCNLVVVASLARVRDYRRKHSTTSLSMSLVVDADDTCRLQVTSRRRKQKDIEFHMICVMFAITTIFAVCWVPLMIHIIFTLANKGVSNGLLGLIAVRMASLNQTLNPWLYVILRRSLVVKVKNSCCKWRSERRKKAAQSAPPVGRRHQYVHVGNRLCHRNNFVGIDANSQSLSDSMRKSLQRAMPAAMSLPDVMMVNTGRKDLDLPLPDVAKAQSYGGRISHGASDFDSRCCCCDCPSHTSECSQCAADRAVAGTNHCCSLQNGVLDQHATDTHRVLLKPNSAAVGFSPKRNSKNGVTDAPQKQYHRCHSSESPNAAEVSQARADVTERLSAKPPSGLKDIAQFRDFQSSIKNSSSSRERHRTDSQKSNDVDILSSILPPSNRSSFHSQTGNSLPKGAMTQYIHMQKRDSHNNHVQNLSGSSKSHSDDSGKQRREASAAPFPDDSPCNGADSECNSGDVFLHEDVGEAATTSNSKNDNTTDGGIFSSNPTESVCFSDALRWSSPSHQGKPLLQQRFDHRLLECSTDCGHNPLMRVHQSHAEAYQKLGKHERTRSKSYTNDGCDLSSTEWRPDIVDRHVSLEEEEEDGSSGIFSVESPTNLQYDADVRRVLGESKNGACSDQTSNSKANLKQMVRRIKSAT